MQAYEFQTTLTEDIIRIPQEFTRKLAKNIRVIILSDDANLNYSAKLNRTEQERFEAWEQIKAMRGTIPSDIDEKTELAEAREEKYGYID